MESEEAIMENENNSNVESESIIRVREGAISNDYQRESSDAAFDSVDLLENSEDSRIPENISSNSDDNICNSDSSVLPLDVKEATEKEDCAGNISICPPNLSNLLDHSSVVSDLETQQFIKETCDTEGKDVTEIVPDDCSNSENNENEEESMDVDNYNHPGSIQHQSKSCANSEDSLSHRDESIQDTHQEINEFSTNYELSNNGVLGTLNMESVGNNNEDNFQDSNEMESEPQKCETPKHAQDISTQEKNDSESYEKANNLDAEMSGASFFVASESKPSDTQPAESFPVLDTSDENSAELVNRGEIPDSDIPKEAASIQSSPNKKTEEEHSNPQAQGMASVADNEDGEIRILQVESVAGNENNDTAHLDTIADTVSDNDCELQLSSEIKAGGNTVDAPPTIPEPNTGADINADDDRAVSQLSNTATDGGDDCEMPMISEPIIVSDNEGDDSEMPNISEIESAPLMNGESQSDLPKPSETNTAPLMNGESQSDLPKPPKTNTDLATAVEKQVDGDTVEECISDVEYTSNAIPKLSRKDSIKDNLQHSDSSASGSYLESSNTSDTLDKKDCSNSQIEMTERTVQDESCRKSIDFVDCDNIDGNRDKTSDTAAATESVNVASVNESDDDLILVPAANTELANESLKSQDSTSNLDVKAEQGASEDDVVVLDDEGEVLPVKKEGDDSKSIDNGLGIQISEVAGQQHQLHATAESTEAVSLSTSESKQSSKPRSKSKMQICIVCSKVARCKYNIVRNGDVKHLCDDICFMQFRKSPSSFLKNKEGKGSSKDAKVSKSSLKPTYEYPPQTPAYKTCAVCQLMDLNVQPSFCNWKGLDFCGESCLGKFQATLNTSCSFCHAYIPMDMRALYCFKIGNDMRPFCKTKCVTEFKKKLKLCAFCQRDIAALPGATSAVVGAGVRREFCSQACVSKMEEQLSAVEFMSVSSQKQEGSCTVCDKQVMPKHMVKFKGKIHKLCSELCLSAFQYTNKLNITRCDSCFSISRLEETQAHFIQFEGHMKRFCSDHCVNNFRRQNTKVVSCDWCSTKKLNFDMIERLDTENKYQMFCSLTCLSLYRVNHQAKSNQAISCDQCRKVVPAQYHLTMSDASVRNFCSYVCVMAFQSQFTAKHSVQGLSPQLQIPAVPPQQSMLQAKAPNATRPGRPKIRQGSSQKDSFPVISNVISLAPPNTSDKQVQPTESLIPPKVTNVPQTGNIVSSGDGKHQILIQPPNPVTVKNKSLQCRPITQTKATSCKPHSQSKEIQTDEQAPKTILIPVPVPIYIPMPSVMYTAPAPQLVPFPIPIPVPIFIPTTRKSAQGISKAIKEIVERMPADPLEAELLMMAEAVAADSRQVESESESEEDVGGDDFEPSVDLRHSSKEDEAQMMRKRDGQGEEDMIQMALRMAEEMSGPIEDLESSVEPVAVNSDPRGHQSIPSYDTQIDEEYIPPVSARGAKRSNRGRPPSTRPKRARYERQSYADDDTMSSSQSQANTTMEPPPDANYRLKFTYGVNAWRHWVITKNAQLEKARQGSNSPKIRTFPTDILKCTTDELNFTLCLFIKEVRKPNGDVYSADSIYYLCLGIQQYLYENGRIDNIFTDLYFERFTDLLHEILQTLQPKVNSQGQMLCRIEEEHLWESKQLGAHSPFVLLNTLIYFHTKHFILKTAQEHMALSFAQILKHWKKGVPVKGQAAAGKNVSLRFYCLANGKKDGLARKNKDGVPVYEVTENFENPLRCPVKLYEFFLSKCPESIKNRNDIFYPVPERSCVPDSPVWYSTQSIDVHTMDKMLTRVLLVREIQEAHLHAQPLYL
uniref:Znf2 protein n=1 Tax=Biomphalaria glabrata TaxID=6526 RepID=A0A0C9S0H1_BIOGL